MTEREKLDKKLEELRKTFGEITTQDSSIENLKKYFKSYFNEDIISVGERFVLDFTALFNLRGDMRRKFKDIPLQPITITYKRLDVVFYTYDLHPEMGEQYMVMDSQWMKWLYPKELKQSVLFVKKEYLRLSNPAEYYLQVNLFDIDSKITTYIKDVKL